MEADITAIRILLLLIGGIFGYLLGKFLSEQPINIDYTVINPNWKDEVKGEE